MRCAHSSVPATCSSSRSVSNPAPSSAAWRQRCWRRTSRCSAPPRRTLPRSPIGEDFRRRGNVRYPVGPCIGRVAELEQLVGLTEHHRLVTLTGPGGVGKTSLAIELCVALKDDTPDGVWWVELAAARSEADVLSAVQRSLGIDGGGASDPAAALAAIVTVLADRAAMLVLDNCEHVLGVVAPAVEELLGRCGRVRVVATSREGFDLPAEQLFAVPPLPASAAAELFEARMTWLRRQRCRIHRPDPRDLRTARPLAAGIGVGCRTDRGTCGSRRFAIASPTALNCCPTDRERCRRTSAICEASPNGATSCSTNPSGSCSSASRSSPTGRRSVPPAACAPHHRWRRRGGAAAPPAGRQVPGARRPLGRRPPVPHASDARRLRLRAARSRAETEQPRNAPTRCGCDSSLARSTSDRRRRGRGGGGARRGRRRP